MNKLTNLRAFRVLKIARLLRVARAARVLRYASALRMLIYSIGVSIKSVMWAFVLLAMIMYVFGLVFAQEMAQSRLESGDLLTDDLQEAPRMLYWGSLYRSQVTLFMSVCGGLSWYEVVLPLR